MTEDLRARLLTLWLGGLMLGVVILMAGRLLAQDAQPVAPRTLATCEVEILDLKEALVKTQDAAATWQQRAVHAEAQLALQAIAVERQKAAKRAVGPAPGKP